MHIDFIKLVGYTRLGLGQIRSLTMTPGASMQFILATNGYGKSSLVDRLSPLPGEKDLFTADGSQEIQATHRGNSYKLVSDFSKDHPHEFWRNGVNLNDGGTITVQRDLVQHHFKYNAQIHRFVQGHRKFSDMTTAERKDLFTLMCDANFEYALEVFNKIKKQLNYFIGARDTHKKRLVIETAKVISQEEYDELSKQCRDLYEVVTAMIEKRNPDVKNQQELEGHFARLVAYSKERIANLITHHRKANKAQLRSVADLVQLREDLRTEITRCKTLSEYFLAEFEKVDELFKAYEQAKVDSLAGIDKSIRDNQEIIEQARKTITIGLEEGISAQTVIDSCNSVAGVWSTYADQLHDNSVKNYNRVTFTELMERISQLSVRKHEATERKGRAEQMLEHQMLHANSEDIECPKCNHTFKLGFNAATVATLKQQINEITHSLEGIEKELKEAEEQRETMRAYFQAYNSAVNLFKSAPGLGKLLDYLNSVSMIANSPTYVANTIQNYRAEAGALMRIQQAMASIQAAEDLANKTMNNNVTSGDVVSRRDQLEKDVAHNEQMVNRLINQEKEVLANIKLLETIEQQREELRQLSQKVSEGQDALVENFRKITFNNLLRDLQSELAQKEQALRASERQLAVIEHITTEIRTLTDNINDMEVLAKELSPKEGLIAEGIFSFMKRFVADVNASLRKVWSYPLIVKPCAVERGDSLVLNYRFPLVVSTDPKPRKDISEGSEGMVEAIDLAFRTAGMKALGLHDFPLVLDEYGRTFDDRHKRSSVHMVGNLLDTSSFSQIFMISHDISQYGSIERAEVCVLDASNIVLPPNCVYNKHVEIT